MIRIRPDWELFGLIGSGFRILFPTPVLDRYSVSFCSEIFQQLPLLGNHLFVGFGYLLPSLLFVSLHIYPCCV